MNKLFLFCCFFILLSIFRVSAQKPNIRFTKYGEESFYGNALLTIFQDNKGFIWFGSSNGLVRYDGYEFKTFRHKKSLRLYENLNGIHAYYQSGTITGDNFWFSVHGRIIEFNYSEESFSDVIDTYQITALDNNQKKRCFYEKDLNLWIGADDGLHLCKIQQNESQTDIIYNKHIEIKDCNEGTDSLRVIEITERDKNSIWVVGQQNIISYHCKTGDCKSIKNWAGFPDFKFDNVRSFHKDPNGNLLVGCLESGLYIVEPQTQKITHHYHQTGNSNSLSGNSIWSVYEDLYGNYWIGTERNGLNLFNREDDSFFSYQPDETDFYSIGNKTINDVFVDSSGVLWVCTYNGLNYANLKKKAFYNYLTNPEKKSSAQIKALVKDKNNNIWAATDNGLFGFDTAFEPKVHYKHDPGLTSGPSHYIISSLDIDKNGILWLGTYNGLNSFDPQTKKFDYYFGNYEDTTALTLNFVNEVYVDKQNTVWAGTNAGLVKFNRKTKTFKRYVPDENNPYLPGKIFGWNIKQIFMDNKNNLWVTTDKGLNKMDIKTDKFTFYPYLNEDEGNIPAGLNMGEIGYCPDDILWIASNLGLLKFDINSGEFVPFPRQDVFLDYPIAQIIPDDDNNIWIGTDKGILFFQSDSSVIKKYSIEDGLITNRINGKSGFIDSKGFIHFSSLRGIIRFHPDSIQENQYVPPVFITKFKVFNENVTIGDTVKDKVLLTKTIAETENITITHKHSVITFEFAALNYLINSKNHYAYKLEGFDNDWIFTSAERRYATYTNLPPGKYTFLVKGSNNDGIWNPEPASLNIHVLPHPLRTWWAYSMYILIILTIVFIIFRLLLLRERLTSLIKMERFEAEKNREMDKMKIKFFTNISHEFRTPLTLIVGPLETIITTVELKKDLREMGRAMWDNAQRLLKLVNQLLDLSKLEAGYLKLQVNKGDLILYVKKIFQAFKYQAEKYNIHYRFQSNLKNCNCFFDLDKVDKILYNMLGNAFKYTPKSGTIDVEINIRDKSINNQIVYDSAIITISDTGPGIPEEDLNKVFDRFYNIEKDIHKKNIGSGIGLALSKQLAKKHCGDLQLKNNEPHGLVAVLTIPIHKNYFDNEDIMSDEDEFREKLKEIESNASLFEDYKPENNQKIEAGEQNHRKIVLIVDDNRDIRGYISSELGAEYRILEAENGLEGKEKAEQHVPDIIICDVMMPEMDGYELTELLKKNQITSHIPIIMLTAKATESSELEGMEHGADDYITKPFNLKILKHKIKNILATRDKLRKQIGQEGFYLKTSKLKVTPVDEKFIRKATETVEKHIADKSFNMDYFGKELGMSRVQLFRKLKSLTNLTPSNFITIIRLEQAKQLIKESHASMSEIAYDVGFSSPAYFSRCFRDKYGISPTEFAEQSK